MNISESDADFGIEVALPGFEKEDFVVNVETDEIKTVGDAGLRLDVFSCVDSPDAEDAFAKTPHHLDPSILSGLDEVVRQTKDVVLQTNETPSSLGIDYYFDAAKGLWGFLPDQFNAKALLEAIDTPKPPSSEKAPEFDIMKFK